jgi:hypothetical protein
MSHHKEAWKTWDLAWDNGLADNERLEHLQQCTAPSFVYTNPDVNISDDLPGLVKFISQALAAAGNSAQVEHIDWKENSSQSALQWNMVDVKAGTIILKGWSYGKYDAGGKLVCVADFW